ncbi:hypothetical protein Acr_10g0010540 [Actinidia rufa]|uniref:Retrotransposon gag domain-containing protein n=1 Tax=Actinidia rufa TaxID=165716 RepID=A0A7J0FBT3_9ERIC|nr:hypothetical protein Acr_10g0010540 [Actinidia rufa]
MIIKEKEPDTRRTDYREETRYKRPDRDPKRSSDRRPRTPPRRPEFILPPLNAPIAQVLSEIKHEEFIKWPGKIKTDPQKRNRNKYCEFHRDHGHNTEDCFQLKEQIADLIKRGYLRKYVDARPPPNSPERRKRHARSAHRPVEEEIYNLSSSLVADQTPITFSNDDLRGLHLPHDDALVVSAVIANFNVQRILIDNGSSADILFNLSFRKNENWNMGDDTEVIRDEVEQLTLADPRETNNTKPLEETVPISIHPEYLDRHIMIGTKNLPVSFVFALIHFLKENSDVFAWSQRDVPGIDPKIAMHKLFTDPKYSPVRQKRRKFARNVNA